MIFPTLGSISGGVISWLNSVHPLTWFFAILGGFALGLFISNEIAAKRIRRRDLLSPVVQSNAPKLEWLERLPEHDLDNLKERIKVEVRQISFTGLTANVPHLNLFVRIVNASIFKVKLLRCDGYIQLSGEQCIPPQPDKLPELEHGTGGKVNLHQNIDGKTAL